MLSLLSHGVMLTRRSTPIQYVSPEHAAQVLRVNVNTLYRAIRSYDVPAVRVGRDYRVPVEFIGVTPEPVMLYSPNNGVVGQLMLDLRW